MIRHLTVGYHKDKQKWFKDDFNMDVIFIQENEFKNNHNKVLSLIRRKRKRINSLPF